MDVDTQLDFARLKIRQARQALDTHVAAKSEDHLRFTQLYVDLAVGTEEYFDLLHSKFSKKYPHSTDERDKKSA
jgi:hypothetical protein